MSSLTANVFLFIAAAAAVAWTGGRLARLGDALADRTGLGEALTGALLLGLTTALPGLAASVTAGAQGHPGMAIGNAVGGIAVQTAFLAVADIVYSKANLEHAAASVTNMIQTAILIALLCLLMLGLTGPSFTILHVHPVSVLLVLAAAAGFWLIYSSRAQPMWKPQLTKETVEDRPSKANLRIGLPALFLGFSINACIVTAAGVLVAYSAANIAAATGLNETLAGALLSGIATSSPELATTVAAVRRGALTLAVGNIVGGNFFDVLFVSAADLAYRPGSLYHAEGVGQREAFVTAQAIAVNALLLLGLLYRQRSGPANIGFESAMILAVYLGGFVVLGIFM